MSRNWIHEYVERREQILARRKQEAKVNAKEQHQAEKAFSCGRPEVVPLKRLVADAFADVLPALQDAEYEQLRESIELHGITDPLKVIESGTQKGKLAIVDGHNRAKVAKELEITHVPVVIMTMADGDEARIFVLLQQLGRRNLTAAQRDEVLGELHKLYKREEAGRPPEDDNAATVAAFPGKGRTAEKISKKAGVSPRTVEAASQRVTFTDQHKEYKEDPTKAVNALEKALKKLDKSDQAALLVGAQKAAKAAGWSRMTAKDATTAAELVKRCDFAADRALRAVTEGAAQEKLECQDIIDELDDTQDRVDLAVAVMASEKDFGPEEYRDAVSLMLEGFDAREAVDAAVDGSAKGVLEGTTDTPPVEAGGEDVQAPPADFSPLQQRVQEKQAEIDALNEEKERLGEGIVVALSYAESQGMAMYESPWSDLKSLYEDIFGEEPDLEALAS